MDKNVGGLDRSARLVLGPILVIVGLAMLAGMFTLGSDLVMGTVVPLVVLVVGAVFSVTGYTQTCPANSILGVDTFQG